jgi:hypothetical protein
MGTAAEADCETDGTFAEAGWTVHQTKEFETALEEALQRIDDEEGLDYVSKMPVYNEELDRFLVLVAFDQEATAADQMIDDLVLYVDEATRAIYEVRWFDGKQRHIAYANLSCANAPVPMAYNSMW